MPGGAALPWSISCDLSALAVRARSSSAIDQMFFVPAYPFWSLIIIAADVVALYGLCAYGSRANLQAV